MKKLLALLLALVMVLSFAACGEGDEEEETSRRRKKDTETTSDTTEEQKETEDEDEEDVKDEKKSPYTVFEELDVTVVDNDDLCLTFSDFDEEQYGGIVCAVEGENYSDLALTVSLQAVAVNGMMTLDYFYLDLEAEEESETEFTIYDIDDPEDLTRLSMLLRVTDEDYESEYHLIEIYPQGKKAYKEDQPDRDGEDVLLDENGIFAVTQEVVYPKDYPPQLKYLAFNDSDEVYDLGVDALAINDFGTGDYHSNCILPDTYAEESMDLYDHEYLCLLGMDETITSLMLDVTLDNLDYDTVASDLLTIYPEGKSNAAAFVYEPESDDVVVLETDDFRLLQVLCITDEWNDVTITFVVENKSGKALSFTSDDTKINGKDSDSLYFYCNTMDGRDTFTNCYIYEAGLKEAGITKITSLEFTLEVWDEDYNDIYEGTVKFDVK